MLSTLLRDVPDFIYRIWDKNNDKRKIFTEDILINCPTPICIVGNSVINHEFGNIIDLYATIIRINNYRIEGFEKYIGTKTSLRCVTGWVDLENRNEFIEFSPFTESAMESKNIINYNANNNIPLITALTDIHKFIPEITNPSAGFALVQLFNNLGIDVDLFGFDGFKTNHYWEKNKDINSTHSPKEIDFILKRKNVFLINELYPYKTIYDHCHSTYTDYNENVGLQIITNLKKNISEKNILEFGAGNGDLSKFLEEHNNEVMAVEVSKSAFDRIKCSKKINGDVFSLLTINEVFDLVISIDVLEHLSVGDIILFLRYSSKISRECFFTVSTRPSGLLGPNGENLHITVQDKDWWFAVISKYFDVTISKGQFDSQFILEGKSRFSPKNKNDNYFIKDTYQSRESLEYFVDQTSEESGIIYQPEVYPLAASLGRLLKAKYIIDIGCGSGEKLVQLHPEFEIIGIDFGQNIENCRSRYSVGEWIDFDLESGLAIPIPHEILVQSIIINSDVIEHLENPFLLLNNIKLIMHHAKLAIISTPERELNWGKDHNGPPPNPAHIREWSLCEFIKMLDACEFKIGSIGTTTSNDKEREQKTILSVVVNERLLNLHPQFDKELVRNMNPQSIHYLMNSNGGYQKYSYKRQSLKKYLSPEFSYDKTEKKKIIAIISSFNEGDVIYHVIGDLIENGVSVYLLDHNSTDDTVLEARKWLGKGLIHIENFPADSNYPAENFHEYVWKDILKRKEELSFTLGGDWYIHADADEFRESPWSDMNLQEAISYVDALGYNAIDFTLLQFRPTNNSFIKGDVREYLQYFEEGEDFNVFQIKAWKNLMLPINLPKYGGHEVEYNGRKIFPIPFILRHYPIRSESHGFKKIFQERIPRFNEEERNNGWHIQYDDIRKENPRILFNESELEKYEPKQFKEKLLTAYSKNLIEFLSLEMLRANSLQKKYSWVINKIDGLAKEILPIDKNVDETPEIQKEEYAPIEIPVLTDNKKPNLKALTELSQIHIKHQNYFDAYLLLQKVLKENPSHELAKENWELLNKQIDLKKSEKKWDLKKSTNTLMKAEKLIEEQQLLEAKSSLMDILNNEPEHIQALNDLSVVNILENDLDNAEELINLIIRINPSDEVALSNKNYLDKILYSANAEKIVTFLDGFWQSENGERWMKEKGKIFIGKEFLPGSLKMIIKIGNTKYYHSFPLKVDVFVNDKYNSSILIKSQEPVSVHLRFQEQIDTEVCLHSSDYFIPSMVGENGDHRILSLRIGGLEYSSEDPSKIGIKNNK